ncbi:MAG: ANTAR domain-containing protein [Eubacterium sp.]|nr:ANTAR domain-containing protein [Eubacterium sp.]
MGCIVITMPRQGDANRLKDIIRRSDIWEDVVVSSHGSETLEIVENRDVGLVICTKKMGDMGYEELASYLPPHINILLLTQDATLTPFSSNIMKLLMPFKPDDLISSIRTLLPEVYYSRRKKKKPKERSPEEKKVIDSAKEILMERNEMTEPEAFRYIQKTSMDTARSMLETAQMILLMNGG